jgi:hypothetical protein
MNIKYYIFFTLFYISILYLSSCKDNTAIADKKNQQILATIGDDVITVDEFRKNYELGFANLKTGKNRKKTYLDYMINEKLLALEGYKFGLDESENVKKSEESLKRELLIELLIQKKVKNKIKVTKDEIKESINKSKVKFKFRYWYESTYNDAKIIANKMRKMGYAKVVEEILMKNPEYKIDPKYFETDYLNYLELSPELLSAIKDLPYGEISDPVELKGKFYIFQVLDIRRNAVTENEYNSEASSIEQVVFYRKFEKALVNYGTTLLDKKSIKTKRKAFNLLADAIIEWKDINKKEKLDFIESLVNHLKDQTALTMLSENLDEPFFEFEDGYVSIHDFLKIFDAYKFLKDFESKKEYLRYLHTVVAQSIRDYFLVEEAKNNKLQKDPKLQQELSLWKDKWVYEEVRNETSKKISISKEEIEKYFDNNKKYYDAMNNQESVLNNIYTQVKIDAVNEKIDSLLNQKIDLLKNQYNIEINEAILDTISVVDFKKSRWATMQIFKTGSNRPAYPVVDLRLNKILKLEKE